MTDIPRGAPIRREIENFSEYSDMSILTISPSYNKDAKALTSCVFPTPVGPRNKKVPEGRFGSDSPARERRTASAITPMATFWAITDLDKSSSRCSSCLASFCISFYRNTCPSLNNRRNIFRHYLVTDKRGRVLFFQLLRQIFLQLWNCCIKKS